MTCAPELMVGARYPITTMRGRIEARIRPVISSADQTAWMMRSLMGAGFHEEILAEIEAALLVALETGTPVMKRRPNPYDFMARNAWADVCAVSEMLTCWWGRIPEHERPGLVRALLAHLSALREGRGLVTSMRGGDEDDGWV
jgi:hypothetical protein